MIFCVVLSRWWRWDESDGAVWAIWNEFPESANGPAESREAWKNTSRRWIVDDKTHQNGSHMRLDGLPFPLFTNKSLPDGIDRRFLILPQHG